MTTPVRRPALPTIVRGAAAVVVLLALAWMAWQVLHARLTYVDSRNQAAREAVAVHPSGASPRDLEVLRWIATSGNELRQLVSDACSGLEAECSTASAGERQACFERVLPGCERALAEAWAREGTVPEEVRDGFVDHREMSTLSACVYRVVLAEMQADRTFATRLRTEDGVLESGEELIQREAEVGRPRAVEAQARITACVAEHDGRGGLAPVARWMRARFGCAVPHPTSPTTHVAQCCTVERAASMLAAGIEPGPPNPVCH